MGVSSTCYKCQMSVLPTKINPPKYRGQRRTNNRHSCEADDCHGSHGTDQNQHGGGQGHRECAHPESREMNRKKKVMFPSNEHASSGSTVDTFLPQDDMEREFEIMSLIAEEEADEKDYSNEVVETHNGDGYGGEAQV